MSSEVETSGFWLNLLLAQDVWQPLSERSERSGWYFRRTSTIHFIRFTHSVAATRHLYSQFVGCANVVFAHAVMWEVQLVVHPDLFVHNQASPVRNVTQIHLNYFQRVQKINFAHPTAEQSRMDRNS